MAIREQNLKALLTDTDLTAIANIMGGLMNKQAAVLASKQDLREVKEELVDKISETETRIKTELKSYMNEGFEAVMEGLDAMTEKLAEKEKVDRMESWIKEASFKLGLKYQV